MNLSTALVLSIVISCVVLAIRSLSNDKINGKLTCGGNCGSCGNSLCHDSKSLLEEYKKTNKKEL